MEPALVPGNATRSVMALMPACPKEAQSEKIAIKAVERTRLIVIGKSKLIFGVVVVVSVDGLVIVVRFALAKGGCGSHAEITGQRIAETKIDGVIDLIKALLLVRRILRLDQSRAVIAMGIAVAHVDEHRA